MPHDSNHNPNRKRNPKPRKPTKSQMEKIAEIERVLESMCTPHQYAAAARSIMGLFNSKNPVVHAAVMPLAKRWYDERDRWTELLKAPPPPAKQLLDFFEKGIGRNMRKPGGAVPPHPDSVVPESNLPKFEPPINEIIDDIDSGMYSGNPDEAIQAAIDRLGNQPWRVPGRVYPSKNAFLSGPITEEMAGDFLSQLDFVGVEDAFDPANKWHGGYFRAQPLFVFNQNPLNGVRQEVYFDDVWLKYDSPDLHRIWDPEDKGREVATAFAMDYILVIANSRQGWTWKRHDKYLCRLPHWTGLKFCGGKHRPAWESVTPILVDLGFITAKTSRSWRLTPHGKKIARGPVEDLWRNLAKPE